MRRLIAIASRCLGVATVCSVLTVSAGTPGLASAQAVAPQTLHRPASGFSMAMPAGWQEYEDPSSAAAILLTSNPSVVALVRVLTEDAMADSNATLASWLATLFADAKSQVVSESFEPFLGRPALVAELEGPTTRVKVIIVARDAGDRSQVFYALVTTAPSSVFGKVSPSLGRIISGFQITAMNGVPSIQPEAIVSPVRPTAPPPAVAPPPSAVAALAAPLVAPSPAPQAAPPLAPAPAPQAAPPLAPAPAPQTTPPPAPPIQQPVVVPPPAQVPSPAPAPPAPPPVAASPTARNVVPPGPVNRALMYERILAPGTAEEALAAATPTKDAKSRAEAAAAYDRGMVFVQQAAWAEAEKEFRTAERRDGDNVETVLATAWIYNKLHKPDEALKRYDKVYKKNPRNTRALVGMAVSYEEMLNFREEVRIWQRYQRADLSQAEKQEGQTVLRWAQDMFANRYEVAENPGGGAVNALTKEQELQLGQNVARELAKSGIEPLRDETVTTYVMNLCAYLVANAKNFPSNYEVFVVDTSDVNASTIPGYIFVNRGLLAAVSSESELAGVLAHEIGHVVAHHSAKSLTKQVMDQQQAEQWRNSDSKFLRWLGSMSASGSSYSQASFSREAEEQADRLAVHITFDSGIDPRGFATFFQKLESIAPSSRKAWDLMSRTHPFSIDRLNTINAYIDLLPDRPTRKTSAEFVRMQKQLAALPPPSDVTGMQRPAIEPRPPQAPAAGAPAGAPASGTPGGATTPFTLDVVPFAGEIPAGWDGRKLPSGTIVFEGPKGTEAYEVSIELELPPRIIRASYSLKGSSGNMVPLKHLTILLDYPGYYAILSYYTPESIYQKYSEAFTLFLQRFRYTGR
ncbi:MAG: M48 family metalloprotease [Acidobacteria bacterium]|nr:M48 family metalloprotease [Acidobacteriota bacterium]